MINRQELYNLFCELSCDSEQEHFCALSISAAMPDFVDSFENSEKTCANSITMLSDEDLQPIFHYHCSGFPVWYRDHIPGRLLVGYPFIYEQTRHTLSIAIDRILYRRGGGMKFDDLCVEFMALHQGILSDSEKKLHRVLLTDVITSCPEELSVLHYENRGVCETFVGLTLSEETRDEVRYASAF